MNHIGHIWIFPWDSKKNLTSEESSCEPHHLGGSLKEGEDNIKEAKEIFLDTNALKLICCWN